MVERRLDGNNRPPLGAIGGLLFLSLLWACGPLRSELLPQRFFRLLPGLAAQTLPLALLAFAAGTFAWLRKAKWPRGQLLQRAVWIGLGLFTAPALLVHLSAGSVSGPARTALFTLVPVFSLVLEPYIGHPAATPIRGGLPAALAAVLGALLVFPSAVPTSIQAEFSLLALILAAASIGAANCCAEAVFRDCGPSSTTPITAIAAFAGTVSLGAASLALERPAWQTDAFAPELLWAAAIELPQLLLLFWLMRRLSAVRLATRFVLGPLLLVPAGALLVQIPLAPRTCLGLLGMAAGAAYLLFSREADPEKTTLLGATPEP